MLLLRKKKHTIWVLVTGIVLILGIVLISRYLTEVRTPAGWSGYTVTQYTLYNKKYTLLVADTPQKQEKGLMYVRKPDGFDGMIFRFPKTSSLTFWNKNTYRDLDLYWIRNGTVVGKDLLPSIEKGGQTIVSSPEQVDTVVEIIRPF